VRPANFDPFPIDIAQIDDVHSRASRQATMWPVVLEDFVLVSVGASQPPAYPGVPGHEPDVAPTCLAPGES
jgi:hypothetical protein